MARCCMVQVARRSIDMLGPSEDSLEDEIREDESLALCCHPDQNLTDTLILLGRSREAERSFGCAEDTQVWGILLDVGAFGRGRRR